MGVVKQEVNRSAGSMGFMGSNSLGPQDASCILLSKRHKLVVTGEVLCGIEINRTKYYNSQSLHHGRIHYLAAEQKTQMTPRSNLKIH